MENSKQFIREKGVNMSMLVSFLEDGTIKASFIDYENNTENLICFETLVWNEHNHAHNTLMNMFRNCVRELCNKSSFPDITGMLRYLYLQHKI